MTISFIALEKEFEEQKERGLPSKFAAYWLNNGAFWIQAEGAGSVTLLPAECKLILERAIQGEEVLLTEESRIRPGLFAQTHLIGAKLVDGVIVIKDEWAMFGRRPTVDDPPFKVLPSVFRELVKACAGERDKLCEEGPVIAPLMGAIARGEGHDDVEVM